MQNQITAVPKNGKETQAELSAGLLRDALQADHGIPADTHDGYDLALVSVRIGLVVWCDGVWFWWRAGWDDQHKRVVYARDPATEPARAARRVAFRYADLRRHHPLSEVIDDLSSATSLPTGERTE